MYVNELKLFTLVLENATHDTLALVALSKRQEIVVALRGTDNFWNSVLDIYLINTSPEGADQIKIHRGFYIATMSLYDRVSFCKWKALTYLD